MVIEMKKIIFAMASLALGVILSGCSEGNATPGPGPKEKEEDTSSVYTLASYNVKCDNGAAGDQSWSGSRRDRVCKLIRQRDFDVCGLVEVTQPSIRDDFRKILGDVYSFIICGRDNGSDKGEAVGFCYKTEKFNLLENGYFYLNTHPDTPGEATEWYSPVPENPYNRSRIAAWGLLEDKIEGTRFIFIASHFELNEGMQEGSAKLIVRKAKEFASDSTPVFFCGDLNAVPTEKLSIGELSNYFTDSYDYAMVNKLPREGQLTTYNKFNQYVDKLSGKRIDYLFYRGKSIVQKKYGVIYDLIDGVLPSDHYPIYIEVSFKKP